MRLRLSKLETKEVTQQIPIKLKTGETTFAPKRTHQPSFVDFSVEALVTQASKLSLITGEGGSGKTTSLRRLAFSLIDQALAERDVPVPVVLKARQVASCSEKLIDLLTKVTADIGYGSNPFDSTDLMKGSVAVLVDALEEVQENERNKAVGLLLDFHHEYPQCPIVITSRDYRSILELGCLSRFTHYWVLPVGLNEVDCLITRATERRGVDPVLVKSTLRKLADVHGVSLSPMLVTVFVASSDFSRNDLPPNIAEVFSKFTEQMIGRWDERKGLSQQYEAKTKDFLLQQLAFAMHKEKTRSLPVSRVEVMFADAITRRGLPLDPKTVFDEVVSRSGLLRVEDEQVIWRHHLLQEFFAGRGVPNADFFASVVDDEWWRTPMVFYFGNAAGSFANLWNIIENSTALPQARMFDAAITIGLSVQACYLAEVPDKQRAISWVLEAFGIGMGSFRQALESDQFGCSSTLSLCYIIALGRDAVGTRILRDMPHIDPDKIGMNDLFAVRDENKVEAWRIVGLLEAGEFCLALYRIKLFKTQDRDLLFMIFVSIGWTLYMQDVPRDSAGELRQQRDKLGLGLEDMRESLFRELKTLFFEIRKGKLIGVENQQPVAELESKHVAVSKIPNDLQSDSDA